MTRPCNGDTGQKRPKKDGTLVSAYIAREAHDALRKHCELTGQSKTKAIERAILAYCGGSGKAGGRGREQAGT